MKKIFFGIFFLVLLYVSVALYRMDKIYFLCPIEYKGDMIIRSDGRGDGIFGARRGNGHRSHNGIDLFASLGTPVLAPRSGRVQAVTSNKGMGMYVILKHSQGILTLYGHLSAQYVRPGEYVRQGQMIGRVGKTGNANFRDMMPHLHFEVRENGLLKDPLDYLE